MSDVLSGPTASDPERTIAPLAVAGTDADSAGAGVPVPVDAGDPASPTTAALAADQSTPALVVGTAGNDILGAGIGVATLRGGRGDDRYVVNDLEDVVIELPNEGFDRITLEIAISNFVVPDNVEQLILGDGVSVATPASTGSKLAGLGNDNLFFSGPGTDFYDGNGGRDTLSYANATTGVEASFLKPTAFNTGGAGTDKIDDMEILIGSDFADVLVGGQGVSNEIFGGGGDDLIVGFAGPDRLTGGAGADRFMYNRINFRDSMAGGGEDTIVDFERGTDQIDLSRLGIRAADLNLANGRLEADVDGDGTADFAIDFENGVTPNFGDILLSDGPAVAPPEITVRGNGREIRDGDTTPAANDFTDFGTVRVDGGAAVAQFFIHNDGESPLDLSGARVAIGGAHASDFFLTRLPAATVGGGTRSAFEVTFDPSAGGVRSATVEITSNDRDEASYSFSIAGSGQQIIGPGPGGNLDVMLIGDSFSIPGRGLPQKLEAALENRGLGNVDIIDLTQSGRNSAGAKIAVDNYFADSDAEIPEVAILAIGINDAIQQQPFNTLRGNLDSSVDMLQARGVEVVLAAPEPFFPLKFGNQGFSKAADQAAFRDVYDDLAASNSLILADDFLANGLTTNLDLLEGDRFHPEPAGVTRILNNILPEVLLAIDRVPALTAVAAPASVDLDDLVITG